MADNKQASLLKPIIILVAICALTGLALGAIDNLTSPVIATNEAARVQKTYADLIPSATAFVERPCDIPGVTACIEAEENQGYIIVSQAKGYGGEVPVAVAFSPDGTIERIQALPNNETPNLGSRVTEPAFINQFVGRGATPVELQDIDAITGATISSKAALAAVNEAIDAFCVVKDKSVSTPGNEKGVA